MASAPPSAFVTGGSGFIGSRLIRRLVGDGWRVRALARSERSAATVREHGAEPVHGDLTDVEAMAVGAAGSDVAFHLAAHLGQWGAREDFERDNVAGTENALAACSQAGVRRFVHCGTEAALLAGDPLVDIDEAAPLRPDSPAPYSATKARAERAVLSANGPQLEAVVVRPRFVWGAGDTTLLPGIVEAVEGGRFAWIGGGGHLTATTHVDNTVEGLVLGAVRGRPGEAYFVTDGDPVVFREFVSELIATQGLDPPTRSLPAPMARAGVAACELAWRMLPLAGEPPLTRLAYWLSAQECTIDISKARRELDYRPIRSRADGLVELRRAAAGGSTRRLRPQAEANLSSVDQAPGTGERQGGENRAGEVAHAGARGVVGAMAMTGIRVFTRDLGIVKQTPPEAIAKQRAQGLMRRVPRKRRRATVELAHWGYGAVGGGMFGLLPATLRRRAWAGPAYGLAAWLAFELALAPVLGLRQTKRLGGAVEQAALATDHLLYGLVLSEGRRRPQE